MPIPDLKSLTERKCAGGTEVNFGSSGCNGPLGRYVVIIHPSHKLYQP